MSEEKQKPELDDFWDVDLLLPKKAARSSKTPDTDTVLVELDAKPSVRETAEQPIPPSGKRNFSTQEKPQPDEEYAPENPLIKCVRIYRWRGEYPYYERFFADVKRLYPVHGVEVPYAAFFSFVPQYSQMRREQLLFYLWWREQFRRGEAPSTVYSYVLLYSYELLNSEGLDEAAHIQELLARLWLSYRRVFLQLDSFLPQWICEYGLIHRLTPPASLLGDALPSVLSASIFKEYFLPGTDADSYAMALLAFSTQYHYKKSKFYTPDTAQVFDRMIPGAIRELALGIGAGDAPFFGLDRDVFRYTKESFTGAICPYRFKRKLEVEYYSFSRSLAMRNFITSAVKYAENRVRAGLGIHPKLSVKGLDPHAKLLIDAYFDSVGYPALHSEEIPGMRPDYERNYDLPQHEFSLNDARRIEAASWQTTEKLLSALGGEPAEMPPIEPEETPQQPPQTVDEGGTRLPCEVEPYRALLFAYADGDRTAVRRALATLSRREDLIADEINAAFFDEIGDILLEEGEDGYRVIPDYLKLLRARLAEGKEL